MAASRNPRGYDGQQCYPTVVSDGHLSSSASVGSDGLPVEATVGSDGRQSNPSPGVTTVSKVIPQWVATVNQSSPAPVGSDGQPVEPTVGSDGQPHHKKRFTSFTSPAGMSLTKLPLGRNNSVMTSLFPPRESLVVTSLLGTGNSRFFFLRCTI